MSIREVISTADILLIITGIAIILMGGLIANIYVGVGTLITSQIANITKTQTGTNYVQVAAQYVPLIINMLGLVLVVAAVVHIIVALFLSLRKPAEAARVPGA